MKRISLPLLLGIMMPVVIIILLLINPILTKNMHIRELNVQMSVNPDSTIAVEENFTVISLASYPRVDYRIFDMSMGEVENIQLYHGKSPLNFDTFYSKGRIKKIRWEYDTAGIDNDYFTLTYDMKNAIDVYDDIADLRWKFRMAGGPRMGPVTWIKNWPWLFISSLATIDMDYKLELPQESSFVKYWAYPGIRSYDDEVTNHSLSLEGFAIFFMKGLDIKKGTYFRIDFDASALNSTEYANKISGLGHEKVVSQEKLSAIMRPLIRFLIPVIVFIILFIIVYFTVGREYKIKEHEGGYEREIPYKYSPAIVSALINQDTKKPVLDDFIAVILNLCAKKNLELKKNKDDYDIIFKSKANLAKHELDALEILEEYATAGKVSFNFLNKFVRKGQTAFKMMFESWQEQVKLEALEQDFYSVAPLVKYAFFAFSFGFMFYGLFLGPFSMVITNTILFLGIAAGIGMVFLLNKIFRQALPKRTMKGALHYIKWMNFKRFLEDFGEMKKYPPEAIVMWEKYLAYSLTLGVADKVKKSMKIDINL